VRRLFEEEQPERRGKGPKGKTAIVGGKDYRKGKGGKLREVKFGRTVVEWYPDKGGTQKGVRVQGADVGQE